MLFPNFFSFLDISLMKLDYEYYALTNEKSAKKREMDKVKRKRKRNIVKSVAVNHKILRKPIRLPEVSESDPGVGLASTLCLDPWQHSLHLLHILFSFCARHLTSRSWSLFLTIDDLSPYTRPLCHAVQNDRLSTHASHCSMNNNLSEQRPGTSTIDRYHRSHSISSTIIITTTNMNATLETRSSWWKTIFISFCGFGHFGSSLPSAGHSTN